MMESVKAHGSPLTGRNRAITGKCEEFTDVSAGRMHMRAVDHADRGSDCRGHADAYKRDYRKLFDQRGAESRSARFEVVQRTTHGCRMLYVMSG